MTAHHMVSESTFEGRNPFVKKIFYLYFDKNGSVISTASKIGAKLGITRNAVVGHMGRHRDIFPKQDNCVTVKRKKSKKVAATKERKAQEIEHQKQELDDKISASNLTVAEEKALNNAKHNVYNDELDEFGIPKIRTETTPTFGKIKWKIKSRNGQVIIGKSLADIDNRGCRYVVDDTPGSMLMCGKIYNTYPYCSQHSHFIDNSRELYAKKA